MSALTFKFEDLELVEQPDDESDDGFSFALWKDESDDESDDDSDDESDDESDDDSDDEFDDESDDESDDDSDDEFDDESDGESAAASGDQAPQPDQEQTVDIGGVSLTKQQLQHAISCLTNSTGNQIKNPLAMSGSPLAAVDTYAIAAAEAALDPTLRKGNTKTKKALLCHLHKKLAEFDTPGASEASPPEQTATPAAPPGPPPDDAPFAQHLHTNTDPVWWTAAARKAFFEYYALDHTGLCPGYMVCCCSHEHVISRIRDKLRQLWLADRQARLDDALAPRFTAIDPQPTLTGWHKKLVLVDQHGERWLFKPAAEGKAFRADVEHHAHRLARRWGFMTAESRLITFEGVYGQAQRMFTETGNFAAVAGQAFNTFTVAQLVAVASEHILDWALDNDDTKGDNLIITEHGQVVGVDKARAWCHYGGWDGLSSHNSADSNAPLVYTALYQAIKDGDLAKERVDTIYQAVIAKARRMQTLPDAVLESIVRAAVAHRPHFKPPSYRTPFPGAPTNAEELVTAATARKRRLVEDMHQLWVRVYQGAGWDAPELVEADLGYNAQGHPLHAGLHSPGLHEAVTRTKSYGTATFVAGTDIEDSHILVWRERVKSSGVFRIRGQFKVRDSTPAYTAMRNWCVKNATIKDDTIGQLLYNDWYWSVIQAYTGPHYYDNYYMSRARVRLCKQREAAQATLKSEGDDHYGRQAATVAMCEHYEAILDDIEKRCAKSVYAWEAATPTPAKTYAKFTWAPPTPPPPTTADGVRVELRKASRAAASTSPVVQLADDGELDLSGEVLENSENSGVDFGQYGKMYLIVLPTGEEIEFRAGDATFTSLSMRGTVQFTIPDQDTMAVSLHRIDEQLRTMGLTLAPADRLDLELFYWRHLRGVLAARRDSRPDKPKPAYRAFWELAPAAQDAKDRDTELAAWRTAFATLPGGERIEAFVAGGGHLPRFLHLDQRRPQQPCGKPHWLRFDVSAEQIAAKGCLVTAFGHGPRYVIATGAAMSTEARLRTFATWKSGSSSHSDLNRGSGDFTFTRQNQEGDQRYNIFFRPDALARTSTYTFEGDLYGQLSNRTSAAHFGWAAHTKRDGASNEVMTKYALSLLDDVEVLVFKSSEERDKAIAQLAGFGITEIRGVPVAHRFIHDGGDRHIAIERARRARQP